MPETKVIFFMEEDGSVPVFDWLDKLSSKRARAKCLALLRLLALTGHELRRPRADTLRDGIRELRAEVGNVNYRLLYFFSGKDQVVISHGITKEDKVPDSEIDRAIQNRQKYRLAPLKYCYCEFGSGYEENS
jgi:phage-related protein